MGFSAMLAENPGSKAGTGISSSTYRYRLHHGATFFATSFEIYSASAILFIFSYRAGYTQNISTTCPALREQKALAVSGKFIATFIFKEHPTDEETYINTNHVLLWLFIDLIRPGFQV